MSSTNIPLTHKNLRARRGAKLGASVALALFLSGCATFSDDGGFGDVEAHTRSALGLQPRWSKNDQQRQTARAEVTKLLTGTLDAEAAMQIALNNNLLLQAEYANLGISEADLVQAGRLPNPGFTFGKNSGGGTREIERGLHVNLMAILTLPLRSGIETRRFEAAKMRAAAATVETALEAKTAFFEAVAARQSTVYLRQVIDSAEASRELTRRMTRVGNASRLALAREELFHAEASAGLARAAQREDSAREKLIRSLGLWGSQIEFELPERLPELPVAAREIANIEQLTIDQRLDIRQARHALMGLADNLGLTRATRFINVLETGPVQIRERGEPIKEGYEISLEIPIFDFGDTRIARAESMYTQAADRLRATAVDARSQVRQAYRDYHTSFDLARHYRDEIVPLRKRISEENLLRYNGMLIGVFELIADAREQVSSVSAYLDAMREFWIADTNLQAVMLTGAGARGGSMTAAALTSGAAGGGH